MRHLAAQGCVLIREGGNHSWWGNPARNLRSAVPRHTEINKFLARKICRDLGIAEP
jgi:mRNA interferase HicA